MTRVLVLCCPFELSNPEWTLSFFLLGPIYNVVIDQSNYMCALINLSFVGNDKRGTTCHLRLEHWPHLSGLVFVFLLDHSFLEPSLNLLGFLANPTVASSVLRMQGNSELGAPFYTAHTYFKILINNFFFRRRSPDTRLSLEVYYRGCMRDVGVEPPPAACSHAGIATGILINN
jgi:hypothetical protein